MTANDSTQATTKRPERSAKLRALTLRPHEARKLAETGEVLIVRDVKPQPGGLFKSFGDLPTCQCHPYGFHDNERHYACPFGPVGSMLWGRETWAEWMISGGREKNWRGEEHGWGNTIYKATFRAGLAPVCEGFSEWRSSTSMPRHASRFPRLCHESCEVKRAVSLTWDDIEAMGLPDEPRSIVKPGSVPIEHIEITPADMLSGLLKIPADRWLWCSLVRKAD